jgi:hypothetical protein
MTLDDVLLVVIVELGHRRDVYEHRKCYSSDLLISTTTGRGLRLPVGPPTRKNQRTGLQ